MGSETTGASHSHWQILPVSAADVQSTAAWTSTSQLTNFFRLVYACSPETIVADRGCLVLSEVKNCARSSLDFIVTLLDAHPFSRRRWPGASISLARSATYSRDCGHPFLQLDSAVRRHLAVSQRRERPWQPDDRSSGVSDVKMMGKVMQSMDRHPLV